MLSPLNPSGGPVAAHRGQVVAMEDHCDDVQCRECQAGAWTED